MALTRAARKWICAVTALVVIAMFTLTIAATRRPGTSAPLPAMQVRAAATMQPSANRARFSPLPGEMFHGCFDCPVTPYGMTTATFR